jgi:tRNA threonylcarbamoyladenosine biosynthesis protein TsaE
MSADKNLNEGAMKALSKSESSVFLATEQHTELFGRLLANATQVGRGAGASNVSGHATIGGRIFLSGELGAGKTTMTRGLVQEYGHLGAVKSPTYTLVEPYELANANVYHFDLYRLSDPEEVGFLGVEEYFAPENLCIIEWAEKGAGFLPRPDIIIEIEIAGSGRRVRWKCVGEKGALISQKLTEFCQKIQLGTS